MRVSDMRTLWSCTFRLIAAVATGNRETFDNTVDDIEAAHKKISARRSAR